MPQPHFEVCTEVLLSLLWKVVRVFFLPFCQFGTSPVTVYDHCLLSYLAALWRARLFLLKTFSLKLASCSQVHTKSPLLQTKQAPFHQTRLTGKVLHLSTLQSSAELTQFYQHLSCTGRDQNWTQYCQCAYSHVVLFHFGVVFFGNIFAQLLELL